MGGKQTPLIAAGLIVTGAMALLGGTRPIWQLGGAVALILGISDAISLMRRRL